MYTSHPSRVCGLKYVDGVFSVAGFNVTPFTGVWIEIVVMYGARDIDVVTPFTGVWIEIYPLQGYTL